MKVLILGGTRFFGKRAVRCLLNKGYDVTIATRGITADEFGDEVSRIVLDRTSRKSLEEALAGQSYDVVYDNICFTPDKAKDLLEVMEGRIGRYIVTSSLAVYEQGMDKKEEDFDPYTYSTDYEEDTVFTYAEGKRVVEAVAYQNFSVPTVSVRFPVVIGNNDYTRRLAFYVQNVYEEKAFTALNNEDPMSFVTEDEAGEFLALLAESDFIGPINPNSNGIITVKQIIELIEEKCDKKAKLVENSELVAPYSRFGNVTLDNTKAVQLGGQFGDVKQAFEEVIAYELSLCKNK